MAVSITISGDKDSGITGAITLQIGDVSTKPPIPPKGLAGTLADKLMRPPMKPSSIPKPYVA